MRKARTSRKAKTSAQILNETETEAQLQENVRKLADSCGWRYYHPWVSLHSSDGWPDVSLLRGKVFMVLELKSESGKVTDAQREWLAAFNEAHIEAWVVRPSDWDWLIEKLR